MQLAQARAGCDTQLGAQPTIRRTVRLQRLRLPSGAVQREHQQFGEALAQRVLLDQGRQFGDRPGPPAAHRPARGPGLRLDLQACFQDGEPPFLPLPAPTPHIGPGHPRHRFAAPERQRRPQRGGGLGGPPVGAQHPRPGRQGLAPGGVEAAVVGHEQVAAAERGQHVRPEDPAQPVHIGPDDAVGAGRRLVAPQVVDQLAARHLPARPEQQGQQQRLLLRRAQRQFLPVPQRAHRPEHLEPQPAGPPVLTHLPTPPAPERLPRPHDNHRHSPCSDRRIRPARRGGGDG